MIADLSNQEWAILAACHPLIMQDQIADLTTLLAAHIERVLQGDASRPFIGMSFDLYCRALLWRPEQPEAIQSIERLCDRSEARFGQQPWTDLNRACLRHIEGDWPASVHLYRRAGREAEILWPGSRGCTSVIDLDEAERWAECELVRPVRQLDFIRSAEPVGVIGLVACDSKYLRMFWPIYIDSAFGYGGGATVHLHIIDPQTDDVGWAIDQAGAFAANISITVERYEREDARAWYATSRFLILPQILRHYRLPVVVTDIDVTFLSPIDSLIADADVGLRFKRSGFRAHPWQTIQAGAFSIRPTSGGILFADSLRALGVGSFQARAGVGMWFVDQNMLFTARRAFASSPDVGVCDISGLLPDRLQFWQTSQSVRIRPS
jgi:hypothetical protein